MEGLKTALAARDASAAAATAAAAEAEARRAALAAQLEAAQAAANAAECRANDAAALAAEWKEQAAVLRRQLVASDGGESPRDRTPRPHPRKPQAEQGGWGGASPGKVLGPQTAALLAESETADLIPAARAEAAPALAGPQQQPQLAAEAVQPVVLRISVVEPPPEAQRQVQRQLEGQVAALTQRCSQLAGEAAALHEAAAAAAAQHAQRLEVLEREHEGALADLAASHAAELERQAEQHEQELRLLQQQHAAAAAEAAAVEAAAAAEEAAGGSSERGGAAGDRTPSPLQRRFQQKLRQVGGVVGGLASLRQRSGWLPSLDAPPTHLPTHSPHYIAPILTPAPTSGPGAA